MRRKLVRRLMFAILLLCQLSICLGKEAADPNDSTKYLNAVREFTNKVMARTTRGLELPAKRHSRR